MRRLAVVLVVALAAAPAAGQQVGTAMPQVSTGAPDAIEAAPAADAPMAVRRRGEAPGSPPPVVAPPPPAPPSSAPGSITVQIDSEAPPPENDTPRLILRDVTERPSPPVKSLAEREAAVEALRQRRGAPRGAPQ